jgi:DNA-3-methyladenine glycosylase II
LLAAASPLTPERFLKLNEVKLKQIGFSRQKTKYGYELARAIIGGQLDLPALHTLHDDAVRESLMRVKGIGRWTADVYLLMVLRRPDIWPVGDLALATAVQHAKRLPVRPTPDELETIGGAWRPWRAVAARMLWHFYLSGEMKRAA